VPSSLENQEKPKKAHLEGGSTGDIVQVTRTLSHGEGGEREDLDLHRLPHNILAVKRKGREKDITHPSPLQYLLLG